MKAIETKYKGYRFRSRLEARWAVFFDALGIKWEYEPEGFELGGGVRYLPDFFLPGFGNAKGMYVEVKPTDDGFAKAERFARLSGVLTLFAAGTPALHPYRVADPSMLNDAELAADWIQRGVFSDKGLCNCGCGRYWMDFSGDYYDGDRLAPTAVRAARGARFEFGESGAQA